MDCFSNCRNSRWGFGLNLRTWRHAERGKRGFDCDEQKVEGSGNSPQSCAKGSEGKITERGWQKVLKSWSAA